MIPTSFSPSIPPSLSLPFLFMPKNGEGSHQLEQRRTRAMLKRCFSRSRIVLEWPAGWKFEQRETWCEEGEGGRAQRQGKTRTEREMRVVGRGGVGYSHCQKSAEFANISYRRPQTYLRRRASCRAALPVGKEECIGTVTDTSTNRIKRTRTWEKMGEKIGRVCV
jgi:hypothetical protein